MFPKGKIQAILGPKVQKIVVFDFLHSLVSSFITIVVLFLLSERWEPSQKNCRNFCSLGVCRNFRSLCVGQMGVTLLLL